VEFQPTEYVPNEGSGGASAVAGVAVAVVVAVVVVVAEAVARWRTPQERTLESLIF
jgi:hypothetical protein